MFKILSKSVEPSCKVCKFFLLHDGSVGECRLNPTTYNVSDNSWSFPLAYTTLACRQFQSGVLRGSCSTCKNSDVYDVKSEYDTNMVCALNPPEIEKYALIFDCDDVFKITPTGQPLTYPDNVCSKYKR